MILIFANSRDHSTKLISEWIEYFNLPFIRINEKDIIELKQIIFLNEKNVEFLFVINGKEYSSKDIHFSFFRGGGINLKNYEVDESRIVSNKKSLFDQYASYFSNYSYCLNEFSKYLLNNEKSIGVNKLGRYNKLLALDIARKLGLSIPETILTTSKKDVIEFLNIHGSIITKSLDIGLSCFTEKYSFNQYTKELNINDINLLPYNFTLSKFQRNIQKEFEIRTFYIRGNFYSSAILSQQDLKTKTDSRKILGGQTTTRVVPYQLPKYIEEKLNRLMKSLNLDTGSIDIIRAKNTEYYFLEVNPIGQFGMISEMCNQNLHYIIAKHLLNG